MNNDVFKNIIRFVALVLAQVVIFNNINFSGYINPYVYILFVIGYPFASNRTLFLFISFLLGLTIDMFTDAGGINAIACLVIAYIRPVVLRFSFGVSYEYHNIKIIETGWAERFTYVSIMTVTHHLILFSLETFNASLILSTLMKTLFSSIFTIILCLSFIVLFSRKRT